MGHSGLASAQALSDLVANHHYHTSTIPTSASHHHHHHNENANAKANESDSNYLSEIARYWRTWTGTGVAEAKMYEYEEVWSYVAGRALVQE